MSTLMQNQKSEERLKLKRHSSSLMYSMRRDFSCFLSSKDAQRGEQTHKLTNKAASYSGVSGLPALSES